MAAESLSELTYSALLKVRQKLLDLSKRNRLLNFKETARSIRIIDELPDQIYKSLVSEIKSMALIPVEETEQQPIRNSKTFQLTSDKLNFEEFVKKAITSLRGENEPGIHTELSGFNNAFRKYYGGEDPIQAILKLESDGKITVQQVEGGFMLYLNEHAGNRENKTPTN